MYTVPYKLGLLNPSVASKLIDHVKPKTLVPTLQYGNIERLLPFIKGYKDQTVLLTTNKAFVY